MSNPTHEDVIRDNANNLYSAGNLEIVEQNYRSDAVVRTPDDTFEGHDGVRRFLARYREAFPHMTIDLERVFSAKNYVCSEWTFSGKHTGPFEGIEPTGRRVHLEGASVSVLAKNRIERERHYWDRADLLEQLGLSDNEVAALLGRSRRPRS